MEVDNFLPIFDYLQKNRPDVSQQICILQAHTGTILTKLVLNYVPPHQIISCLDLLYNPKSRLRILKKLAVFISIIERFQLTIHNWFLRRIFARLVHVLYLLLERNVPEPKKSIHCDYLILSGDILANINKTANHKTTKNVWYRFFRQTTLNSDIKKILIPETFDQWNEVLEFEGKPGDIFRHVNQVLSRGDSVKEKNCLIPKEKIINIGSPRY
ncbi:hypothetical protein ACFLZT_03320, partial [Thermodesulfobacteriota bacterium]